MNDQVLDSEIEVKKESNPMIKYIENRVLKYNQNFILLITGRTGSGKSNVALKMGEAIDPSFNVNQVVFSIPDFVKLLNSGYLHKGSVVVLEEAGTNYRSRDWFSDLNKNINNILQTFRIDNLVLLITVPHGLFIDTIGRNLAHAEFNCLGIDRGQQLNVIEPKFIVPVTDKLKPFRKFLRVKIDGQYFVIKTFYVGKCNAELWRQYEFKAMEYKKGLQKSALELVEKVNKINPDGTLGTRGVKPLTTIQLAIYNLRVKEGKKIEDIAKSLNKSISNIGHVCTAIRNKGYVI